MSITVVIPAYNEEQAIGAGKLRQVAASMIWFGSIDKIIVVDDKSTDLTAAKACQVLASYLRPQDWDVISLEEHAGKAAALIAGIKACQTDYVLISDMDQATPIDESPSLIFALKYGADIAIGSRGYKRPGAPASRYILSWCQMLARRVLLGLKWKDTQCGFKAFRADVARDVIDHLQIYGHQTTTTGANVSAGFDVEFLLVAERLGYAISEVPVSWHYQATRRVRFGRDAWRGLLAMIGIWAAKVTGQYPSKARTARIKITPYIFPVIALLYGVARLDIALMVLAFIGLALVARYQILSIKAKGESHGQENNG